MAPPRIRSDQEIRDTVINLGTNASVRTVAVELGLHTTTARNHLDRMVEEGQLSKELVKNNYKYRMVSVHV